MDWLKIFDLEIDEPQTKILVELCLDLLINFEGWEHRESQVTGYMAKEKLLTIMVKLIRRRLIVGGSLQLAITAFFNDLNNWINWSGLHYSDSVYDFVVCAENKLDEIT